jgi:hypothetical protein
MACRHAPLGIGVFVNIEVPGGTCSQCGGLLVGYTGTGEYLGHRTDGNVYDVFALASPYRCPHCNVTVTVYREPCNEGGVWPFT